LWQPVCAGTVTVLARWKVVAVRRAGHLPNLLRRAWSYGGQIRLSATEAHSHETWGLFVPVLFRGFVAGRRPNVPQLHLQPGAIDSTRPLARLLDRRFDHTPLLAPT
jgi:hypothetical protein